MSHAWRSVAFTGAAALLGLTASPALAQDGGPADLTVSLAGPATGTAGGTGEFSIDVANTGDTDALHARVSMALPADVHVSSVGVTDDWACVFSPGDLSCELEQVLEGGQAAETIPVVLAYDVTASGPRQLVALAEQEAGGLRVDRGTTTVTISAAQPTASPATALAPAPTSAEPVLPPTAPPTTAPPTTAPAGTAAQAPQPTAVVLAPEPAPAPEVDEPAVEALAAPAPVEEQVPSSLPFAADDEPTAEASGEPADDTDVAAAPVLDEGIGPTVFALGVVVALLVLAEAVLLARVLRRRLGSTA